MSNLIHRINFRNGFYLYTIVNEGFTPGNTQESFDCEWAEIEFDNSFSEARTPMVLYWFLLKWHFSCFYSFFLKIKLR